MPYMHCEFCGKREPPEDLHGPKCEHMQTATICLRFILWLCNRQLVVTKSAVTVVQEYLRELYTERVRNGT